MFHILVVEDDSKLRHLFCTVLRKHGYTCTEAENGQAAIDVLDNTYIDLIISDIMMPVMDGYQATNVIRSCERADAKTIPIIAMTAKAFDDDRKQSKEAGINAHISKPIEISNLINTIDRLCNNATNSTEVTL